MAIIKTEIRPKKEDGTYNDVLYPKTSADMVEGLPEQLATKAPTSHTHTKAQISDFPTSLPANGGNADTVDGKHASDFRPSTWTPTKSDIGLGSVPNSGFLPGQVLEVGQYIDLHKSGSAADYDARIYVASDNSIVIQDVYGGYGINYEIANLKSSVSSGKTAIANAITGKGVSASGSDTHATLANKITQIPSAVMSKLTTANMIGSSTSIYGTEVIAKGGQAVYTDRPLFGFYASGSNRVVLEGSGKIMYRLVSYTSRAFDSDAVSLPVTIGPTSASHYILVYNPMGLRIGVKRESGTTNLSVYNIL